MFKCKNSYCIPTYLWCDQVEHCPNGEDEEACVTQACPGLLRCRHDNVCVHPLNICDGQAQCLLSRDDEKFCDIGTCPKMCKCQGSVMICQGTSLKVTDIPLNITFIILHASNIGSDLKFVSLNNLFCLTIKHSRFTGRGVSVGMLHDVRQLYSLVLSHSNILFIEKHAFKSLSNLRLIDLTGNLIKEVVSFNFKGLVLIKLLDLSHLSIVSIKNFAFIGLHNTGLLNLSSNLITSLQPHVFASLKEIKMIDLTNNSINYINTLTFVHIEQTITITFSKSVYCCYLRKYQKCFIQQSVKSDLKQCKHTLTDRRLILFLVVISGVFTFVNYINVMFLVMRHSKMNAHTILVTYLTIVNTGSPLYALILSCIFMYHGNNYFYLNVVLPKSYICHFLQFLEMASNFSSQYVALLIAINRLLATRYVFRRTPFTTRQAMIYASFGWLVVGAIITLGNIYNSEIHNSCFPMLYQQSRTLLYRFDIWIYVVLSCLVTIALPIIYISIISSVSHSNHKIRKTGGKSEKVIIFKAISTVAIQLIMRGSTGILLISFYTSLSSLSLEFVLHITCTLLSQCIPNIIQFCRTGSVANV